MSDTYNYEVLEPGGHARLVGNVLDRISKASANPASAVGSSRAVLGDAETASWMERTTAADGAALVESVKGNTLRWNQLAVNGNFANGSYHWAARESTLTVADGVATVTPNSAGVVKGLTAASTMGLSVLGHKYLISTEFNTNEVTNLGLSFAGANQVIVTVPSVNTWCTCRAIWTNTNSDTRILPYLLATASLTTGAQLKFRNVQIFDLTAMFGAGNEPATVAEFEALFPLPYYPYDAGSLLPVRMQGVETVGFNQWDEVWEVGGISSTDGTNISVTSTIRSKNYIPVFPNQTYWFKGSAYFWTYDSDKGYAGRIDHGGAGGTSPVRDNTITIPNNVHYLRFVLLADYGTTYNHDICINLSDPSRNGEYEPYWSSQRLIDVANYFPQGMRSAGSVRDELTATQAITRVGERAYQSGDESDASVITDGTVTHYALATPVTTPIDPPLPMSYRTGAGGTERVMVASGTTSAPPIFATRYPLDPADLAASIAPVDGPIAKTNHQVGDLIMLGFTLCKATQVIVTGETIAIGTNVTKTTVAAELAALSE